MHSKLHLLNEELLRKNVVFFSPNILLTSDVVYINNDVNKDRSSVMANHFHILVRKIKAEISSLNAKGAIK